MRLKMVLLILLVFSSAITLTTLALSTSAPVSLSRTENIVFSGISLVKPLGDPIGGPGFPN